MNEKEISEADELCDSFITMMKNDIKNLENLNLNTFSSETQKHIKKLIQNINEAINKYEEDEK